jgi:hypothetical protein
MLIVALESTSTDAQSQFLGSSLVGLVVDVNRILSSVQGLEELLHVLQLMIVTFDLDEFALLGFDVLFALGVFECPVVNSLDSLEEER